MPQHCFNPTIVQLQEYQRFLSCAFALNSDVANVIFQQTRFDTPIGLHNNLNSDGCDISFNLFL